MRGPYRKLWTDIFSSPYGQSAKRAEKLKQRGKKRWSITYGTDQANEVNKMFIMWHLCWKRKPFMYKNDACQTIDFIGCQKLLCNGFPAHLSQNKPILEWICCLMQKIFKACRDNVKNSVSKVKIKRLQRFHQKNLHQQNKLRKELKRCNQIFDGK